MGGGDLNMKKSWHPLLQKNQERVWQEENRAREERKRIEQKRKEIAEERQLQELQRLQESQGGKHRQERLDWMYTAPGSGAGAVGEQMEQYLLGKRGVEDLIKGDENEKLKKGAEQVWGRTGSGTGMGNIVVDTKNKILADPLLAIKKQEQRKLEELMSNPIKLKQMKKELDRMSGKKEEKKHHKSDRHRHRDDKDHHHHRDRDGYRSEKRPRDRDGEEEYRSEKRHRHRDNSERKYRDRDDDYRSERMSRDDDDKYHSRSRRDEDNRPLPSSSRDRDDRKRDRSPHRPSSGRSPSPDRRRDHSPYRRRRSPAIKRQVTPEEQDNNAKAAAIQAMLTNAEDLESSRAVRLASLEEKEKADREREEQERMRRKGLGGRAGFMKDMQNRILDEGRMTAVR